MHEARYRNATASAESSHRIGAGKPFPVPSLPPHRMRTVRASIDAPGEMVKVTRPEFNPSTLTVQAILHVDTLRNPDVPHGKRVSFSP